MDREHHALNEEINLVGLYSMTVTQRINRKIEVEVLKKGCHKASLMVTSFRKRGNPTSDREWSFISNQRMNNEAYKSEDLEDMERSRV